MLQAASKAHCGPSPDVCRKPYRGASQWRGLLSLNWDEGSWHDESYQVARFLKEPRFHHNLRKNGWGEGGGGGLASSDSFAQQCSFFDWRKQRSLLLEWGVGAFTKWFIYLHIVSDSLVLPSAHLMRAGRDFRIGKSQSIEWFVLVCSYSDMLLSVLRASILWIFALNLCLSCLPNAPSVLGSRPHFILTRHGKVRETQVWILALQIAVSPWTE